MPSSSKPQRGGSESEDAESSNAKAAKKTRTSGHDASTSPPATFWDLPTELRSTILDLASQKPNSAAYGGTRLRLDRKTIHSLTLVSRQFHTDFNSVLYSHVKLTKPSILAEFRQSLFDNPSLGGMVKSLHLGPLSELREGWWPVRFKDSHGDREYDESFPLFKTSLTKRDSRQRPRWCEPAKEWAYELPARTCYGSAVNRAILAALKGVELGLRDPEYEEPDFADAEDRIIGINKWTVRLYEVQAALDLYLCEMRRIEDQEKRAVPSWRWKAPSVSSKAPETCRSGRCGHYPALDLEGFEASEEAKGKGTRNSGAVAPSDNSSALEKQAASGKSKEDVFLVTQAQVTQHLTRPGAHTDHYDHPLIFARSDLKMLARDEQRRVVVKHGNYDRGPYYDDYDESDSDYEGPYLPYSDEQFSQPESQTRRSLRSSSISSTSSETQTSPPPEVFDPTRRNDLLFLARNVISLAPGLRNLSITGWFSRCLEREAPNLDSLRSLSLGPLLPLDSAHSCIGEPTLENVSKLRIGGYEPNYWAARNLAKGVQAQLINLRSIEWDYGGTVMAGENSDSVEDNTLEFIRKLQGIKEAEAASGLRALASSSPISSNGNAAQTAEAPPGSSRYVELRLDPDILAAVIKKAPTSDVATAWANGSSVPGAQYRVRLVESRAAIIKDSGSETSEQDLAVLRRESEQWWEERALENERGELLDGGE